ncbi:MAG: Flp family type IVb pilin [Aquidulcibacter sp.]|jgi:pilus assembly protein Flp/PilA|uniref:Flp family type IVb pilin n=1 Tax=Aquidulcibacter sp. TaxID=2052990 RepID=UPI0022C3E867|nr:Flp family type IVb pilin [Aquidulcibacter sp.]MCE2891393.1 Flp family type IVb pilin [Hyphomonadaceae bacterium]MCZ8208378.1 Flp family type IVb pilin [Aquidulcibacter sp.]
MILKKLKNERGATAIEYGLIIALMVLALIPALQMVGGNTNSMYDRITNQIVTAMNAR